MRTLAPNYVVFKGVVPGIYESRQEAEEQVKDFEGGGYTTYFSTRRARAAWRKHERIAKKIRLSFPIPKQSLILNSVDLRLPTTVILTGITKLEEGLFTINQKGRRFSESSDYSFTSTSGLRVIHLSSFYQMLTMAKAILHLDGSKKITIYYEKDYVFKVCKWATLWEKNNWLTRSGNTPPNLELVKLINPLYKKLESQVSFRLAKN